MAEWIESWDLEAMTSYNREIGVRGPVGTSKLFHHGFSPLAESRVGASNLDVLVK